MISVMAYKKIKLKRSSGTEMPLNKDMPMLSLILDVSTIKEKG